MQVARPRPTISGLLNAKPRTALDDSAVTDHKRKSKLLLGQLEDDSQEEDEIIYENFLAARPPARHKERALNLVDSNEESVEKRPINISLDERPPSRHKIPPKAQGLELSSRQEQRIKVKDMYCSTSLNGTFDEVDFSEADNPLIMTMPLVDEQDRSKNSKSAPRGRRTSKDRARQPDSSKPRSRLDMMLSAWETESSTKRSVDTAETATLHTIKLAEPKIDSFSQSRARPSLPKQKPIANIPIVLNQRSKPSSLTKKRKPSEASKEPGEAESGERKGEGSRFELSHSRRKDARKSPKGGSKTLPFKSSLDAEFLSLFS
jgi:hypothetical protein